MIALVAVVPSQGVVQIVTRLCVSFVQGGVEKKVTKKWWFAKVVNPVEDLAITMSYETLKSGKKNTHLSYFQFNDFIAVQNNRVGQFVRGDPITHANRVSVRKVFASVLWNATHATVYESEGPPCDYGQSDIL